MLDLFDHGVSSYSPNVKSVVLDVCLPIEVDRKNEVMALSLLASTDSKKALAFLDISDCDEVDDCAIGFDVSCKFKWFGEAQAKELKIIQARGIWRSY